MKTTFEVTDLFTALSDIKRWGGFKAINVCHHQDLYDRMQGIIIQWDQFDTYVTDEETTMLLASLDDVRECNRKAYHDQDNL